MCVASHELRLFNRLGYEDLGYETGSEFDAYIATLIPLAQGLVDQFCNVPKASLKLRVMKSQAACMIIVRHGFTCAITPY
jgi:hypothetical protein